MMFFLIIHGFLILDLKYFLILINLSPNNFCSETFTIM